jgi:iron complex outermembrane receptor protein
MLSGKLTNSLSGGPISNATVRVDELNREAKSGADGSFTFDNVPPGTYHLSVHSQGYSDRRTETTVGKTAAVANLAVDPELHFEEVTTVTGFARSQFESLQPTTVLSGQELSKNLEGSLGETLESQPGMASRTFGPAPSRPVIRGLDGDRVQILQDGQRMGDLSSQSGDHGVSVNPAVADRIEVIRGPATLLYGPSAVGGLVNIITEDIPTRPITGATGNLTFDLGSAASEGGAAANVRAGNGRFAVHAAGGGRRSGEFRTPDGNLPNSQSRNSFGNFGASWTGDKGYFGASYGYDDTKYGIPLIESGNVQLTPRRHTFGVRTGAQNLPGGLDSWRATFTARRYKHDELEGDEIGTSFKNDTEEAELMASHRKLGRLKGSVGGWFLNRAFGATGEEALSPDIDQRGVAAFLYEEVGWPHVTVQFGGRIDHTKYEPVGEEERSFTSGSGSVGLVYTPMAANERLTFAASLARVGRNPALEELFYFGPHGGNFAFEIGNPALEPEHAVGLDLSMRWRAPRASGEFTYFRNSIQNFVFRRPMSLDELEDRLGEFEERFPGRELDIAEAEELQIIEQIAADSVLQGIEMHSDFGLTSELFAEVTLDYVRGTLKATDDPLPRMPPFRANFGLRYQHNAFQVGGNVVTAAKQDRLFEGETETDGYALLKLYGAYSIAQGKVVHTITARLDNATDTLYRNHLSYIKDLTPEMGANFKLFYNVKF